jgi:serine protease AprX
MKPTFLPLPGGELFIFRWSGIRSLILGTVLGLSIPNGVTAQVPFEETAPRRYHIEFTNKDHNPFSLQSPENFLSARAISRRLRQGISLTENDLPVTPAYIDSVRATGAIVLTVSKWFNAVTVRADSDIILNRIAKLTFIKKSPSRKSMPPVQLQADGMQMDSPAPVTRFEYGVSAWQTAVHKGQIMHSLGYTGKGIIIALIDAGFYHVDRLPAFTSLWTNGQILGNHDFVNAASNFYEGHPHGAAVLSIVGGNLPGELIGTAPDAGFWLLRSEDTGSEYPIEEDNWASAAEFADSAGVDVINTSLGYTQFDNPSMDLTYANMNGNTARISRAADIASSKGMVVVVSAGNLGASPWHYISAPADADSVLTVGAMDANGYIANFSSRGPTADSRIKPDIVAIGKGTWIIDFANGVKQGNGTSLSAPIITGLVACLWQADPDATAREIVEAVKESSDRFTHPDNDYGYGVPDFSLAHVLLKRHEPGSSLEGRMIAYPNPFTTELYLIFPTAVDEAVDVSLFDLAGKEVFHSVYPAFPQRSYITINQGLASLSKGIYILKVSSGGRSDVSKLIRF